MNVLLGREVIFKSIFGTPVLRNQLFLIKYFLTFIKRYFLHGWLHGREFIRIPMTPILFYHKPSTNDTSPPERIISPAVPKTYFFWGSFLSKYAANHSTGLAGRSLTNSLIPSSRMGTTV